MKAKQPSFCLLQSTPQILFSLSKISSILGSIYLVTQGAYVCTGQVMASWLRACSFHRFEQELTIKQNQTKSPNASASPTIVGEQLQPASEIPYEELFIKIK